MGYEPERDERMTHEQQATLRRLAMADYNATFGREATPAKRDAAFEKGLRECRGLWEGEGEE